MRHPAPTPQKIGKFDILRVLGTGAQSVVYLAHDAHLQREVAIKSLHLEGRDEARKQALMDEARTVSKLRHPNIVPIFDAGEQDGDPDLVFEYVEGSSLAEYLREKGGMPPPRAIEAMLLILDAVENAHRHGIIHRDLKPSNILMNAEGVPRVMDFGIAVRVSEDGTPGIGEGITGTPAYLAPECINDGLASVQSDIFSAGLILCELLTGKPVVSGKNVLAILHRMSSEPIRLPPEAAGVVDDRLGDIILKATATDTAVRYADIPALRAALKAWLTPDEAAPARTTEGGKQSTLDFLLRRMRHKSDFPALSEAISTINRLAASDQESVSSLSNTILKDVALTNKLMRLVNSAFYKQAGGGTISTISRAVMILGFGTVRSIATSLILMEHLQNKGQATQLREEFVRAIMSGILARDMARKGMVKDFEEAFICSMFHNLGRMLACYYFPDETVEIHKQQAQQGGSEATASARVLGITYEELGIGVARSWGFPDSMVGSMRRLPDGPVRKTASPHERLRTLTGLADQLCAVFEQVPAEKQKDELQKVSRRFGDSMPFDDEQLQQAIERSLEEIVAYTAAIRLNLQQSTLGRQIGAWSGKAGAPTAAGAPAPDSIPGNLTPTAIVAPDANNAPTAATAGASAAGPGLEETQAILNAGIQDITGSLVGDYALADILRIIIETMYRGIGFQHVLLCIKDARSNSMAAKFGFGPEIEEIIRRFRFPLGGRKDIFDVALTRGADVLISDIRDPKISGHIPEWFGKTVAAETFILFPLVIKNAPVGLIYADKANAGELVIPENVLSMLRALRNQAVLAIKQSR